jgi:porphobilinogen synthase
MEPIVHRLRRNRRLENIRRLVRESTLRVDDLIWPLFVHEKTHDSEVESMPGVSRLSIDSLLRACENAARLGIPAVAVFPCIEVAHKDAEGSRAFDPGNLLFRAVREVKARFRSWWW